MRIDSDTCKNPVLLAAEVRRLQAVIAADAEPLFTLTDAERSAVEHAAENARNRAKLLAASDSLGLSSDMTALLGLGGDTAAVARAHAAALDGLLKRCTKENKDE